jgi:YD repeat-containing protein
VSGNGNIYNLWTLSLKTGELRQYTDALGGITKHTHDPQNRLIGEEDARGFAATYEYDLAGNLSDDGAYTYQWDYANRLTKIVRKSDSGTVAVLDYDALSRRILKYDAVANITLRFYYSDESKPGPPPAR